ILNSIKNTVKINNCFKIKKSGTSPIFICASGPSLSDTIQFLKEQKNVFIIAVSSAIFPLINNGIIPSICISTDGGFWAQKHISEISKIFGKTILALSFEGNCPSNILSKSNILPLNYGDGIESEIVNTSGIVFTNALRCGTVSGTALYLALSLTSSIIYFCGLDLFTAKGFQHLQPNSLELIDSIKDSKIFSSEKRSSLKEFSNQKNSLKIYEDWFKNQNLTNKVFRIIKSPKNNLGNIKDIDPSKLSTINLSGEKPEFEKVEVIPSEIRKERILNYINNINSSEKWLKNCFPTEYLNFTHSIDENQRNKHQKSLLEENLLLIRKICRQYTKKK
ncbi:MAG: DUF115 domain-containing protein, partial [Treponema sp.]|nr:DUF115 domain-containing protein [Clostridia bacterium]MCF0241559.1 DUF115 domain-containing protein [Treponema sp.]